MLVQPIGPSNTKSPKFLKMAVSYFVDPIDIELVDPVFGYV